MKDSIGQKAIPNDLQRKHIEVQLAGYLSTYVWYEERHPQELLPLAEHCIKGLEKIMGCNIESGFQPVSKD